MTKPINYIEMMDNFAQSLYDTVRPTSKEQPVVIEDMVNAFKELAAWGVKRYEIINQDTEVGGAIGQYQKGIKGSGGDVGTGDLDASPAATTASTGILAQLGTRKRGKKPPRLPSYIESDGSNSGGAGSELPPFLVNGVGVQPGTNGDIRPADAETDSGGSV